MTDESQRIYDLLVELDEEGDYLPERSSVHRAWIEKHFAVLHNLVVERGQPFTKIAKKLSAEITIAPSTLQRHYEVVKQKKEKEEKERRRARRRAKRQQSSADASASGNGSNGQSSPSKKRKVVDPSKVTPPPFLVNAEVVED